MIDRKKLVTRHHVVQQEVDPLSPLSVGNGSFVFTADVTGLQTLNTWYVQGMPLCTMAEWGWNTHPNTCDARLEDALVDVDTYGQPVSYPINAKSPQAEWLRANPHQSSLAQIGFVQHDMPNDGISPEDIQSIDQTLNLWTGCIHSQFEFNNQPVSVQTVCHPDIDAVGIRVVSPLIGSGKLGIALRFPYTSAAWGRNPADWDSPERHTTQIISKQPETLRLHRKLDDLAYDCHLRFNHTVQCAQTAPHAFQITSGAPELTITFLCAQSYTGTPPDFETIQSAASMHWSTFWQSGGAIDLSESEDPRWRELERRMVLSQYLTAIQSSGSLPPQETGLTCSSWFGKFHLEMHWWHVVHFALWNRLHLMEPGLTYYHHILDRARETAQRQGYPGARWPKMVGPHGHESPSPVGPMLIWQQPHPIYYAELCYRKHPNRETLETYRDIVFETAEFMASYAHWNDKTGYYDLGPPLIPAQENHRYPVTRNPTYELEYWHWALSVAQQWRLRLGMTRNQNWDHVVNHLAPLPVKDGLYLMTENRQDSWSDADLWRDHPSYLAALGVMPGHLVDQAVMQNTLKKTHEVWKWERAWGWDFPVVAMCAARLGLGETAIDFLLLDVVKNRYLPNGHNYQAERLPLYLPGNGGLLAAVAMMAAGWDGAPQTHAPGFPPNWHVQWEGLNSMP